MQLTLALSALAAVASANHYRHTESNLVDLWGQCGGKNYAGDTACTGGNTCKVINEWYSQCQPGGSNEIGVWGQCGGKNYNGATKCTAGNDCKAWNEWYSQCVPTAPATPSVPDNYVVSNGVCLLKCDGDTDETTTGITSFEACVTEANQRGRWNAVWDGKTCLVLSTVYSYKMDPSCKSAARYNSEKFTCTGNSDYYGSDIGNTQTRFSRCIDSCEYYTSGGKNCNAVTFVQNPGSKYGTCFFKSIDLSVKPVSNSYGGIACKLRN
uniref:Secreted protein n=1 Tax=Achlya hypogyna TaxID=1202772 RepID=A0A0A7CN94_ACHHY|nr:secreted protein [Achlya hypogyna]